MKNRKGPKDPYLHSLFFRAYLVNILTTLYSDLQLPKLWQHEDLLEQRTRAIGACFGHHFGLWSLETSVNADTLKNRESTKKLLKNLTDEQTCC